MYVLQQVIHDKMVTFLSIQQVVQQFHHQSLIIFDMLVYHLHYIQFYVLFVNLLDLLNYQYDQFQLIPEKNIFFIVFVMQ